MPAKMDLLKPFNTNLESFLSSLGWYYKKIARNSEEITLNEQVKSELPNKLVDSVLMNIRKTESLDKTNFDMTDDENTTTPNPKHIQIKTIKTETGQEEEMTPSIKKKARIEKKSKNIRLFPVDPAFKARKIQFDVTFKKLDPRVKKSSFYGDNLPSFTEFLIKRILWV